MLYAYVAEACRSQDNQMLLELGLQVCKPPTWVLGTECNPSASVVHTLNHEAVSSAQLAHSYHQKEKSQDLYVCHPQKTYLISKDTVAGWKCGKRCGRQMELESKQMKLY